MGYFYKLLKNRLSPIQAKDRGHKRKMRDSKSGKNQIMKTAKQDQKIFPETDHELKENYFLLF